MTKKKLKNFVSDWGANDVSTTSPQHTHMQKKSRFEATGCRVWVGSQIILNFMHRQ